MQLPAAPPAGNFVVINNQKKYDNPAPTLKFGDAAARKAFRMKYVQYVSTHENNQRSLPEGHRTYPKAVVECVDPDLLWCWRGQDGTPSPPSL